MNYTVDAVDKALVLLFLVADQPGLGVTELARRSGMTKARSYRLLETLEKSGLVRRHGSGAIYSLSYMALFLGASAQEQIKLVRLAKKYLGELGLRFNEHAYVRVRDGLESVCIAHWDSNRSVRVHTRIGSRKPLYAGASGKLLTAYAAPDVQEAVLDGQKDSFTENTIVDRGRLQEQLALIRRVAHSVSHGEHVAGTVALAVPIHDAHGAVVAALSMAIPASRAGVDHTERFLDALQECANDFSRELGYVET